MLQVLDDRRPVGLVLDELRVDRPQRRAALHRRPRRAEPELVVDRVGTLDTLEVQVELTESQFANADEVKVLQKLEKQILKDMKDYLGITAKIKLIEPKTLQRSEGKASRVIDKRKI